MVIYFETVEIQLRDIPNVLKDLGYPVQSVNLQIKGQEFDRETCDKVIQVLKREKVDYAISYNFIETISQACLETDIPYISWVYDNPQQELYSRFAHYPCNYIFVFDKQQQKRLRQSGLKNVYYMPLAIYGDKVERALMQSEKYAGQYEAEVAFVGQLYRIEGLENIIQQADAKVQAAMEENIVGCLLSWNQQTKMHGTMADCCVQYFSQVDGHKVAAQCPYVSEQYYYEAAVLSRILANRERTAVLNDLAESHDVRFYTFDKDVKGLSEKVKVCPGAQYGMEVSHVYQQSKINLNITLHCIETGISQRVFDVMAAGGFLLSNYQEELEELFVPGEDLVIYHNMQEMHDYVEYYLTHEEERKRIARNGQAKVLKYHDFHNRMPQVLEIVDIEEDKRKDSYLEQWNQDKFEAEMMRDLALCHNTEIRLGLQQLFEGIESIEDARVKYFEVWETLQTITAESSEVEYVNICQFIKAKNISCFFIIWQIYAKKNDRERILLRLCEYMRQYHISTAIELVSYGLLMTPFAPALLLKKAECLMDLSMWKEALNTLKQMREPQEDILLLIRELETAINTMEGT